MNEQVGYFQLRDTGPTRDTADQPNVLPVRPINEARRRLGANSARKPKSVRG
jgi:hypothetical protein